MSTWVNLHNHAVYSMLDGHGQIDRYMERAAELGMPALALTDHGNIHGWLDLLDAGKKHGVKPIFGMEAYCARKSRFDRDEEERAGKANDELEQRGPYHLTLLARNMVGFKNLIKLSSRSYLEGYYVKPRIDHELLAEHSDGLIILSGCLNGEIQQALLRGDAGHAVAAAILFQRYVGKENFYIEIQDHQIPEQEQVRAGTIALAESLGAKIVPAGDCHYVCKEDSAAHDLMLCVQTGAIVDQENRFRFKPEEFHLKTYEEMRERFPDEWLQNTVELAERINVDLSFGDLHFPEYDLPSGEEVGAFLEREVRAGILRRYGPSPDQAVLDRVEHELGVVRRMGFESYFLVVWDLVKWMKDNGIRVGWGRGSAAGSILSYALGITSLDPLRFGLLFERFLVEGRKSMPDIDIDIDDRFRPQVIEYARNKYGADRVAHIATFNRIGARQAIKDAARVLGYDYLTGDKLSKLVPPPVLGVSKTLAEAVKSPELAKLYEEDPDARKILDGAKGLEGMVRQSGIHAAGVVIAKSNITDYVPVMQRPDKKGNPGPIVTQWDMHRVEQIGLLKIDFLGLRNLGVIDMAIKNIKEVRGIDIDPEEIILEDEATYKALCKGHSMGVFQLESGGMREMMVSIQPNRIEDVMALISLYRPGPMGVADKLYIARKHKRIPINYDHPKLKDVLDTTYGIMLYQEDVLAVSTVLAGFSPGEADDLRKAIGKKEMDKIPLFRAAFVKGCSETSGVDERTSNKIYDDIEKFGGYGFNRAHAASYGMVSYVTAYLKFNYPAEYMAALLSSVDVREKAAPYLNECRKMGINVRPPSINSSLRDFKVVTDEDILFGLLSINGLGPAIVDNILASREHDIYTSVLDFMRRIDPAVLNKATLGHLIHAGALDELVREQDARTLSRDERLDLLELEKRELGLYVSDHPLLGVWHVLEPHTSCSILDLESKADGELVDVGGIITHVEARTTKRGDRMYKLQMEDLTASVEVVVFPKVAKDWTFQEGQIVIVNAKVSQEGDEENTISKLFFNDMKVPDIPQFGLGEPIIVSCPSVPTYGMIDKMRALIDRHPGDSPVYVEYNEGSHLISLQFTVPASLNIKEDLQLLGMTSYEL